jgi:phosphomannomutase
MSATVAAGQSANAVFPKENSSKTEAATTLAPAKTVLKAFGYDICVSFDIKNCQRFLYHSIRATAFVSQNDVLALASRYSSDRR